MKSQGEVIEGGVTMPGDASLSRPSTGQRPGSSSGVACKNFESPETRMALQEGREVPRRLILWTVDPTMSFCFGP